jgi:hypothetical protein
MGGITITKNTIIGEVLEERFTSRKEESVHMLNEKTKYKEEQQASQLQFPKYSHPYS